jgi:hypothetical protein
MRKPQSPTPDNQPGLSRRTLFAGATTVGALAAATTLLVRAPVTEPQAAVPRPAPEKGGGYRLSEHVKQYYKTTLI